MPSKPGTIVKPDQLPTATAAQSLLEGLTAYELEQVASAVIREHRCRLERAQGIFEEIGRLEVTGLHDGNVERRRHDYRIAMLELHAQHQLVSLVVNQLGYVPSVDGHRPILD